MSKEKAKKRIAHISHGKIERQIDALQKEREDLVGYMHLKIISSDWHAVADAAMDIREIEASLKLFVKIKNDTYTTEE